MNKLYFNIIKITTVLFSGAILLSMASCKKFVTPNNEQGVVQSTTVFTTDGTATAAVLGIYSTMMYGDFPTQGLAQIDNGSLGVFLGFAADELNDYTQRYLDWEKNQVLYTSTGPDYEMWASAYSTIYQANAAIAGMTPTGALSDTVRAQLLGEAYFIRAFSYFTLVNMYGDVPLTTTPDYTQNAKLTRTDSATVYQQVISDLHMATSMLTAAYPSPQMVRANLYTAQALLARVYLYQGNYAQAESEADSVLAGPYQLETGLGSVFLNTSTEVIWQLLPNTQAYSNAYDFSWYTPVSSTSTPIYYLSSSLVSSFEPGDQRAAIWVTAFPYLGTTYYYPSKYVAPPNSAATQYNVVLRLAEQYLIRAEARAQQNELTGAASDLNTIRSRSGLAVTTAATKANLLTAIAHERRVELFTEWGHRWFDLKRTGALDATLGVVKPTWTSDARLLPIPLNDIRADPNLSQNPGY